MLSPARKVANRVIARSFLVVWTRYSFHGVSCTTLSRLFTENRVFRFCVAYAFLYGTLRRGKGNLSRSQTTTRNRAKIRQSCRRRVGFVGRMPACCLFAFEVRTIRGSPVFVFREARRDPRGLEYCVYKSASSCRCNGNSEGNYTCRREREEEVVWTDCIRVSGNQRISSLL